MPAQRAASGWIIDSRQAASKHRLRHAECIVVLIYRVHAMEQNPLQTGSGSKGHGGPFPKDG